MLLTYLLASATADADVEHVGKRFYVSCCGTFIRLANTKPVRTCKCAATTLDTVVNVTCEFGIAENEA